MPPRFKIARCMLMNQTQFHRVSQQSSNQHKLGHRNGCIPRVRHRSTNAKWTWCRSGAQRNVVVALSLSNSITRPLALSSAKWRRLMDKSISYYRTDESRNPQRSVNIVAYLFVISCKTCELELHLAFREIAWSQITRDRKWIDTFDLRNVITSTPLPLFEREKTPFPTMYTINIDKTSIYHPSSPY